MSEDEEDTEVLKFGFVLQRSPADSPGLRSFYHLAVGALNEGHSVVALCRDDGVYAPLREQVYPESEAPQGSPASWWTALLVRGVQIAVNEHCAEIRGLAETEFYHDGTRLVDLERFGELLGKCDKVVCL